MTALALQRDLVQAYDAAIATFRRMITERGAAPVPVAVTMSPGDGIAAAIKRRKRIHDALYLQLTTLMKGARHHA